MLIEITKERIDFTVERLTEDVKRIIFDIPKIELSKILGISRPTLDKKLISHNWTFKEKLIIDMLKNKNIKIKEYESI